MGGRWRLSEHGFRVRTAHLMEAIGCRALRHCVPHKVVQSSSRVWESIPRNFTGLARRALLPPKFTFFYSSPPPPASFLFFFVFEVSRTLSRKLEPPRNGQVLSKWKIRLCKVCLYSASIPVTLELWMGT